MSLLICSPLSHFQSSSLSGHSTSCNSSPRRSRKRKRPASPPASSVSSSSSSAPRSSSFATGLVIQDGKLVQSSGGPQSIEKRLKEAKGSKKYVCTWEGCEKSYSKPVRLEEHLRSHTNERPFECPECPATYRRDTHLAAHMRMHAPADEKPFACDWTDDTGSCGRRFWTRSQLKVHRAGVHEGKGEREFPCLACGLKFGKHRLLRLHEAETGCGPGPAPYACTAPGCTLVFPSGSKLRKHVRTHDAHRYSCVNAACLAKPLDARSFASWTALQRHTRDAHPPRCEVPGCTRSKPFANVQALNAHRARFHAPAAPPCLRPSGPFTCTAHGPCSRSYQSARALQRHVNLAHLAPQHVQCPRCPYTSAFPSGIARHMRSQHPTEPRPPKPSRVEKITQTAFLTGNMSERKYACPVMEISGTMEEKFKDGQECRLRFNRIYDVQRHLKSEHGIDVDKEVVKKFFNESIN